MANSIDSVDDALHEREMLELRIDGFLRRSGWAHTSSTPGCRWMWEREIDGRRVLVDQTTALMMQRELEE